MSRSFAALLLPLLCGLSATPAFAQRSGAATAETAEVWRNYDFVPGRKVLKAVDFEGQQVGRFPAAALTFVRGNAQVVQRGDRRWLEASSNAVVRLELPEAFGDAFSLEFRARIPTPNIGISIYPAAVAGTASRYPHHYLNLSGRPGIYNAAGELSAIRLTEVVGREAQVRLQVVRGVAIAYVDSIRVAQVPTADFPSSRVIEFRLEGNARFPTYLTDIVVATGLDDLYTALVTSGEVTTRGILFDSDSDRIRDESNRVLTDLVDALRRADTLRVTIEGHTDAQGEDGYNQKLSERRARAVVAYLVEHGIAEARLTAVGKGESEPAASNDTAEGRRENRRVRIKVTR